MARSPARKPALSQYEQVAPFLSAFCFILMSQALESFLAREVSPSLHGKTSLLFTFGLALTLTGICLAYKPMRLFKMTWLNAPLLIYSLFAIASMFWSINPSETLKSGLGFLAFHIVGMCMAVLFSWRAIWFGLAWALLALGIAGVMSIPMGGLMNDIHVGAFRGLWMEKNATGEAMAVGALACVVVAVIGRSPKYFAGAALMMGLIVFSRSATSLFAACAAIAGFLTIETLRRGPVRFFSGVWFFAIVIALIAIVLLGMGSDFAKLAGRETTFTGRTEIWPTVLRFIEHKPWLGHGFSAFWVEGSDTKVQVMIDAKFEAHNAHNSFFEVSLGVGYVGAALLGFAILRALFQSMSALYGVDGIRRTFIPFLLLVLIISCFESTIGAAGGAASFFLTVMIPKVAEGACLNRKKLPRN